MNLPGLNIGLDTLGMSKSLELFPAQCRQVLDEMAHISLPAEFSSVSNIVISGMGGSALGGRVINSLERQTLKTPVIVSTEYHLPNFVNEHTLVVISSYSGNTEETLSSLAEARARNAQIFILASGGKLGSLKEELHLPGYIFNPKHNPCRQPRMGLGYNITALVSLLSRSGLIHSPENLSQLPGFLADRQEQSAHLVEAARSLSGKIPVLVASEHLKGAAHCFKNQINENAKAFAALFDLPELNHHLLEGLAFPKTNSQNLAFLFFSSGKYHPEIVKRYPLTESVAKKQNIPVLEYQVSGPSRLFEVMDLVQAGGIIAFSLALINGIDPGPIPWVDWYKDNINK